MADQKVSDLPSLNGADVDAADLLYIVDSSAGSAGSKKITVGQYQLAPVSGGTANGVVYLNGSKVVTTGSGLVFDGTNLGVGTSSPGAKLHVKVGTNQNLLTTSTSSKVTNLAVDDAGSGYVDWQQYANQFLWFTASTQRMTLDASGNLGVGASSPSARLHVVGNQFRQNDATGSQGYVINTTSATTTLATLFGGSSFAIQTGNSGTNQLLLDASGNLGLGVTPSAWSGVVAMQLQTGASLTGFSNTTNLVQNAYYNGSWRYISTAAAALSQVTQGAHQWYTAPSGIAGTTNVISSGQSYTTTGSGNQTSFGAPNNNVGTTWTATSSGTLITGGVVQNITFTQAMTLDASGNLLTGVTAQIFPASNRKTVEVNGTSQSLFGLGVGGTAAGYLLHDGTDLSLYQTRAGAMVFGTNNTERARITSDGKFALGWPEARADLDVGTNTATAITKSIHLGFSDDDYYGFRIANTNTASLTYAGTLIFQRGNGSAWVDTATITDGGNLLINTSTIAGAGGYTFLVQGGGIAAVNNNNSASTGYVFSSYRRGGLEIGSVTQNGTTAVLFNTTSDRRLKNNIVPAPSASDVIDAIEIVSHDWKSAPDEHVTYGVIAQDLALVAPQAVLQGDDGNEIEKTWGVDYSKLVPMLIKEIQTLRARVAALESA